MREGIQRVGVTTLLGSIIAIIYTALNHSPESWLLFSGIAVAGLVIINQIIAFVIFQIELAVTVGLNGGPPNYDDLDQLNKFVKVQKVVQLVFKVLNLLGTVYLYNLVLSNWS